MIAGALARIGVPTASLLAALGASGSQSGSRSNDLLPMSRWAARWCEAFACRRLRRDEGHLARAFVDANQAVEEAHGGEGRRRAYMLEDEQRRRWLAKRTTDLAARLCREKRADRFNRWKHVPAHLRKSRREAGLS